MAKATYKWDGLKGESKKADKAILAERKKAEKAKQAKKGK